MLTQIQIRDFATIEVMQLHFLTGITMITGETGAGKSIFIEAIEIALGGRCSQHIIRPGKQKADISLCFDVTNFPKVLELLKTLDLYTDSPECILRRVITVDGRSRCYVNGTPVTIQLVKELGELLFHLHSQHEQQVLLRSEKQREMLDRYANHLPLVAEVKKCAEAWRAIEDELQQLRTKMLDADERANYLQYQLEELQNLQLQPNEWLALESEHHKLTHSDELIRNIQRILKYIEEEEQVNVMNLFHDMRKLLESMVTVEQRAVGWLNSLQSAFIQIQDLTAELQTYLDQTEVDPSRLQTVEDRISQIFNLSRKHKTTPEELLTVQAHFTEELDSLQSHEGAIKQLLEQQAQITQQYQRLAMQLTENRQRARTRFAKEITQTIRSLSLPHGEFEVELETISPTDKGHYPYGNEKVVFLIKTNPDQAMQALTKVISGGELSRLSLAVHLALAHRTNIPTLVFDEIDTGLSGATAEKIGKLLRKLGDTYQVFCVTHQAQVAAYGHAHLLVEKHFHKNITHTQLRLLENEAKTQEIARMLGGEKITAKTLEHAREVIENV